MRRRNRGPVAIHGNQIMRIAEFLRAIAFAWRAVLTRTDGVRAGATLPDVSVLDGGSLSDQIYRAKE